MQTPRGEGHVKREAETGVTCLQAMGRQGLTAADTGSWERREGPSPGSSGGSRTLDSGLLASSTAKGDTLLF